MSLILLRHSTVQVSSDVCYGQMDVPLASSFTAEAKTIEQRLPVFQHIITSPLSRCVRLAEYLGAARGISVDPDARLAEMNFGHWQGCSWDDVSREELDEWANDFEGACPHGGENLASFRQRVNGLLDELHGKQNHGLTNNGHRTLLVTHAGVIRVALASQSTQTDERDIHVNFGEFQQLD